MNRISDKIIKQADTNARWYTWTAFEDIASNITYDPDTRKNKERIPDPVKVYETHSTVLIDRFDDKGNNVEIPLTSIDGIKKLGTATDRGQYMVLVHYTGSGKDAEAIGTIVRKNLDYKVIKQVKDYNLGGA